MQSRALGLSALAWLWKMDGSAKQQDCKKAAPKKDPYNFNDRLDAGGGDMLACPLSQLCIFSRDLWMSHRGTGGSSSWVICSSPRDKPRARLICFPHGGGGAQAYRSWSTFLPDWLEVLAINPPGRGARFREPAVEEMAGMVDGVTRALAPFLDLPFLLFGHSVGALVAFEATRALESMGLRPLHVILSGYGEPTAAKRPQLLSAATDEALLASIAELGLLPADALQSEELSRFILPPLRADFGLADRHEIERGAQIEAPLTVFGGSGDPIVAAQELDGWRAYAGGSFGVRIFDGGHFFTETARGEVLKAVPDIAARSLAALPPSLMTGAIEDYPLGSCLHELFRAQAKATPQAPALYGTARQLTFAELDEESDLLARYLVSLGCGPDRMVAILMETSADFAVAYLAILKAGGAYLPIPPVTPDRVIGEIFESVAPVAAVTSPALAKRLPEQWRGRQRCVVLGENWMNELQAGPLPALESMAEKPGPDSLAYCVMTSGTTGKPKGIICPHKGAVNSYWWRFEHLPYGEGEREACNVFFVWEVLRPLLKGQPAYIIPDDVIFDPRRLIDFLEMHAITRVLFTPSLFEQVLNFGGPDIARRLSALRMVILNGEVVSAALAARARALLPQVALINDYSISECHDVATSRISEGHPAPGSRTLPAGRVMANVRVYILDEELAPVPWGVPGEVYVAGPTLARGYLNLPAMTSERFLPDPFQGGQARMFRTGDVGRALPDGQLEIRGRSHFMIKLRGYSVVPSAVEAAIAAHPTVGAAIAAPINDPLTGQPASLAAYIVGRDGPIDESGMAALRSHLKERLPAYAIPAHLIPLAELPIQASTGKVDRKRLPPPMQQQAATPGGGASSSAGIEREMSKLWSEVLGRTVASHSDNFFDLGGHSLLAIQLALAAEKRFGAALDVVDVFNYPALGAFCEHVAGQMEARGIETPQARSPGRPARGESGPADIAVIGMACRFPSCNGPEELWDKIAAGVECIRKFSDDELRARGVPERLISNPAYVKAGAILDGVDLFDPKFFGISEREAILMDPQHRIFLECCWESLERAGYAPGSKDVLTGVYAGCYLPTYLVHHLGAAQHLDASDPAAFHLAEIGNDKDYLASRAAYLLGLEGPAIAIQTSCSTGLAAIAEAAEALRSGRCDMALAGASSITFPQGGYTYAEGFIGARDGHCRTFDEAAGGTILGDGVGAVVLRRLEDAIAAGDNVLAVIKGYAVNNDGAARAGFSAPGVRGQAQAISAALEMAQADAGGIGYVEAHGTATVIGDPIEVRALTQAFRRHTAANGFCTIGSVKPNLGHSNIAAGVAGFMKTVLMLQHRSIPPLINFTKPNPELKLGETPFRIETKLRAWETRKGERRRAGVSSFGIGGTNAHMILEEAPDSATAPAEPGCIEILPISAKSGSALSAMASQLASHLGATPELEVAETAATLQLGRAAFPWRRAEIAASPGQAAELLRTPREAKRSTLGNGGSVLVFPGQGARIARLDRDLLGRCPAFARHFAECRALFQRWAAIDLHSLVDSAEAARLMSAAPGLQAALFATEYSLGRTLIEFGLRPLALAGHSLGQIVAAVIGGMLPLDEAVRLVAVRASAMEQAPAGVMLSLVATLPDVKELLAGHPGVAIAAINSPRDVVVSGPEREIAAFEQALAKAGIASHRLAVARAFHSTMMRDVARQVADAAATMSLAAPKIPVACNITGRWLGGEPDAGEYWSRHILAPVDFAANAAAILALNPSAVIEAGPGKALTRFIGEAGRAAGAPNPAFFATTRQTGEGGMLDWEALCRCIARLWESGFDIDWRAFREGRPNRRAVLPTYRFERRRCWPARDMARTRELAAAPEAKLPPEDRFYAPSFRQVGAPHGQKRPFHWLILRDEGGQRGALANALERELGKGGGKVECIDRAGAAQLGAILQRLGAPDRPPRILSLWSLHGDETRASAQALAAQALELAKTLANRKPASPLYVFAVCERAFASPGMAADPAAAGAAGPLLVLGQEYAATAVRFIDIGLGNSSDPAALAKQIADECSAAEPRREAAITLRAGRFVERFDALSLGTAQREAGRQHLARGPHIITGGLGRIGLALGKRLAELGADVILTSRRPASRSAQAASGAIEVRQIGLTDREQVEALLLEVARRHGRIGGIFHAAGLARLAGIPDVTADLLEAELEPKVSGTLNLARAIRRLRGELGIEPSFVMTFSSLAAVLGGLGMAAYASANRAMDALAAENSRPPSPVGARTAPNGVPWISVRWDDWDFEYGEQQLGAYAQTRARFSITPEEGLGAIEAILGEPSLREVLVSATPLQPRLDRWVNRAPVQAGPPEAAMPEAGKPITAEGLSPEEERVRAAYAKVLGAANVGLDDNFFDLGGDSLLAVQVIAELNVAGLRVTDVFDYPAIRGLAARFSSQPETINKRR